MGSSSLTTVVVSRKMEWKAKTQCFPILEKFQWKHVRTILTIEASQKCSTLYFFVVKLVVRPSPLALCYDKDDFMETEQRKNRLSCLQSLFRSKGQQRTS